MPARVRLLDTAVALAEDLRSAHESGRSAEDFSASFQVCLPYRGLFTWHVAGEDVVGDANQVLFVTGGEAFRLSQPGRSGYAELIITPCPETLAEIAGTSVARLGVHPLFRRRSHRADPSLQRQRAQFLHGAARGDVDSLAREETVLALLRSALDRDSGTVAQRSSSRRLIARTKEYVTAHACRSMRLAEIAQAVGASPAYLTDTFRRAEGVPLHRYIVQLRLSRALSELPHADDLTALALDLGFCSHSHFTAAFRRAFHCTPSEFRVTCAATASHRPSRRAHTSV